MIATQIALLAIAEALGLFLIVRLWLKKGSLAYKIIWSLVLLVPVLGALLYVFISHDPSAHGEDVGDFSSGGGVGDSDYRP